MTALLHVVCGWCQSVMVEGDRTQPTSHGLCGPCATKLEAGARA